MQLIEDDALERTEQIRRVGGGQQQRQLLRRGQQNLRRIAALALALRTRRIAGAGLDADRQPHLRNRRFQITRNIDGERFERRNVKRVQPAFAADAAAGGDEAPRLPSPLWGGAGGGGREVRCKRRRPLVTSRPPSPTLPHKGGGSRSRKLRGTRFASAQLHQARQKSRQRLAAAGRRDQQHRAAGLGLGQQFQLMRARRPAAAGEPAGKRLRQDF